jgi:hypothetical protein
MMKLWKCACVGICLTLSISAARAEDAEMPAPDLAAHDCAAKNGTFDASSGQCKEPSEDSPSGDLVVGPMMKVLGPDAQSEHGSDAAPTPAQ